MDRPDQGTVQNRLLRALAPADYDLLRPHLEIRQVPKAMVVIEPDKPVQFGLFFEGGLGSVLAQVPSGQTAEVGLYGWDGFAGIPLVLQSVKSPHQLVMQIGGTAWAIGEAPFQAALRTSDGLRAIMLRYIQYFLLQMAETCVLNALIAIDVRLARWLLMSHDRMPDDEVPLTHEYLAFMLGATRTTVTAALSSLADQGLIQQKRGNILILDRAGLERFAGPSYGLAEREYERLIGALRRNGTAREHV